MKIENKIEAEQLIIALVARRQVLQARARAAEAEEAITSLIGRAIEERRALVTSYRYLAVGEIIQKGDEIRRNSQWVPVKATIGNPVRRYDLQDFRRPL